MPSFFPSHNSKYDGQSEIADSNGEIVAGLKDEEAVIVGKVTLDPALKRHALGAEYSKRRRWVAQVPFVFRAVSSHREDGGPILFEEPTATGTSPGGERWRTRFLLQIGTIGEKGELTV